LWILHGRARDEIVALAVRLKVQAVYANRDYEPAALARDREVQRRLLDAQIQLEMCKDQVIFECDEVLTQGQRPFSVFTPYKKAWLARLRPADLAPHRIEQHASALAACSPPPPASLEQLGFRRTNLSKLGLPVGTAGGQRWLRDFISRMDYYQERRDYPADRS